MKVFYIILKVLLWCVIAWFAYVALYQCYDYIAHPEPYQYTSVAWYISIIINGVLAGAVAGVLLIVMWIVKRKMKK